MRATICPLSKKVVFWFLLVRKDNTLTIKQKNALNVLIPFLTAKFVKEVQNVQNV